MQIEIKAKLQYTTPAPCKVLLQIEAAEDAEQSCEAHAFSVTQDIHWHDVAGEEGIGRRRWGQVEGLFDCTYQARVNVKRPNVDLRDLSQSCLLSLPSDVTKFLMPSRYCFPEDFVGFAPAEFGDLTGGALIATVATWIEKTFAYDISASNSTTTATQSFQARAGVCRDYAHVLIAFARARGIPARFVSAYGIGVQPQDFHAIAEVYLDGVWYMVDPTGMTQPNQVVRIGVGRDAADVSFLTSYGFMTLVTQTVDVHAASK